MLSPEQLRRVATDPLYAEAHSRFIKDTAKCFQRHLREVEGEKDNRPKLTSLKGARVERVTNAQAAAIILRYEWLATMAAGTFACFGLRLDGELLGVTCLNRGTGKENRAICGMENESKAVCIARGACVPWAPPNAASFLIRWTCKLAAKEVGAEIFFAYSDADAGEIGTVYQASGWFFLGRGNGRGGELKKNGESLPPKYHLNFFNPETNVRYTTYQLSKMRKILKKKHGIEGSVNAWLRAQGFQEERVYDKSRYVWFEGPRAAVLKAACKYPILPYPKRESNYRPIEGTDFDS